MALVAVLVLSAWPTLAADTPDLRTVAEKSAYRATARHAEVVALCDRLAASSEQVTRGTLGRSHEGRELPLLILADPPVMSAKVARASDKCCVLLFGNIHAGEVCGKEALLALTRELAVESRSPLLDDLIIAIAPIFNADGNERVAKDNRPGQVGPAEGMGERANAQGLDLNRDWIQLESPENRALVRFLREWDPTVIVDTHTTNGSLHRYTLTYQGPKNPAGDGAIIEHVRDVLLPTVRERVREDHDLETFVYGNFAAGHGRWETYPAFGRYGTPYRGLRNRIAILSEAYSYAGYRERIDATRDFVRAVLRYAAEHRELLQELVAAADRRTVEAGAAWADAEPPTVAIASEPRAFDDLVTVLGYAEGLRPGASPADIAGAEQDWTCRLVNDFRATRSVSRPRAYLVPAELTEVIDNLERHGIRMEVLRHDIELELEKYLILSVSRAERAFQGHRLASVECRLERQRSLVPANTVVVPMAQPLGSLAAYLLEPRSEDGLVTWNFFDEVLETQAFYPVRRLVDGERLLTSPRPSRLDRTAERRRLDFTRVYESDPAPDLDGDISSRRRWLRGGDAWIDRIDDEWVRVDRMSGRTAPLITAAVENSLAALPAIGEEAAAELRRRENIQLDSEASAFLFEHGEDLWVGSLEPGDAVPVTRLTSTPEPEELTEFSPDGRLVSFVRDNDLWVVDVETATERALTTGGSDILRHGKAAWVYFEEVFHRDWKAYWWSPDSRRIAFLQTDSEPVPDFTIVGSAPFELDIETTRYPRPGEPNPRVRLGLVSIAGETPIYPDLGAYDPADTLITGMTWHPLGKLVYVQVQNRTQTWLDLIEVDVTQAETRRLFRETTQAWVKIPPRLEFLLPDSAEDEARFIFLSERSGWQHAYLYSMDGELIRPLTEGEWEVRAIESVDGRSGQMWVRGTRDSHQGENLYRVSIETGAVERLTPEAGHHSIRMCEGITKNGVFQAHFIDTWSSRTSPPRCVLRDGKGQLVRVLDSNPVADLDLYDYRPEETFEITCRDGVTIPAAMIQPADFDASKRYPVWFMTYGGPHRATVRDRWGGSKLWAQVLAAEGIVVFRADPRSASERGAESTWKAYRQLGVSELRDVEDAIGWLREKPWVDPDRIGMSGHSYGGFLTAYAMTHCKLFCAGISGAPVTDWRLYDSIYTERYMGTPEENPEGYAVTSVIEAAANLHGRLLLAHGTMDDNVHLQNSMALVEALQKAAVQFDLMLYPGARHGLFSPHWRRLRFEFIREALIKAPSRSPGKARL